MSRKKRFSAIIFDLDGVIVDSMPYHFIAWYEALRPLGTRVSCFEVFAKEGENWEKSLKEFLGKAGIAPKPALLKKIFASRQKIFKKYFRRHFFPGAADFIFCLKKSGYRLGLVTGTPLASARTILPEKLFAAFDAVVSGDSVKQGKPHPEPYLKAARLLKLPPRECAVIENAPLGIESAKKAGMFCFAVTTSLPAEYLRRADCIVSDLRRIMPMIEKAC